MELLSLPFVHGVDHFQIIDSTSTVALAQTMPVPSGKIKVFVANRQSRGRGQRENRFFSDHSGGLWVTLLQKIPDLSDHFRFNRAISVAIARTLKSYSYSNAVAIKWPNDILWQEKKTCGILLETSSILQNHICIGFGININIPVSDFPAELRDIATSLFIETGRQHDKMALLADILNGFNNNCTTDPAMLHEEYRSLLYGRNKRVKILDTTGIFVDVGLDGRCALENNGQTVYFSSGPLCFLPEQI